MTPEGLVKKQCVDFVENEMLGEVRQVQWIGRKNAPDTVIMCRFRNRHGDWMPTVWVEFKRPGGGASFPSNAHERAQYREHKRMRGQGQTVLVIDSLQQLQEFYG